MEKNQNTILNRCERSSISADVQNPSESFIPIQNRSESFKNVHFYSKLFKNIQTSFKCIQRIKKI